MGGQPEKARKHFQRAVTLSNDRNLLAKVLYAEHYARMAFNRDLHDRLLKQVLDTDPHEDGLTLQNVYARKRANTLLAESADYFD
jgi:hypothetical protein